MRIEGASLRELEAMALDPKSLDSGEVASEFEALLLGAVWKQALEPLGASQVLGGGSAGRMYQELFVDEVARRIAHQGGFGLAAALSKQLGKAAESPEVRVDE